MAGHRWDATRARVRQEANSVNGTELWARIASSRLAGRSVDLPVKDLRSPVRPGLIVLLILVMAGSALITEPAETPLNQRVGARTPPELDPSFDWFATPVLAQSSGAASTLPAMDPPDLARLTARRMIYRHAAGYDGVITEEFGQDTIEVARDTVAGQDRVVISYNSWIRRASIPVTLSYSGVDTLALTGEGRFLFLNSTYARNDRPDKVSHRSVLIRRDSVQFVAFNARNGKTVSRIFEADFLLFFESPLVALLPALPLRADYARSFGVLDLVGGETSPGFRRRYELRVVGRKKVTTSAGTFRCWKVELRDVPTEADTLAAWKVKPSELYVDAESGSLVRAVWNQTNGYFREQVLVEQRLAGQRERGN